MITNNVTTQQGEVRMDMLWYPGQDVDFLGRMDRVEKAISELFRNRYTDAEDINSPYSVTELEAENKELRMRVDDLEELVIDLTQQIGDLQESVSPGV